MAGSFFNIPDSNQIKKVNVRLLINVIHGIPILEDDITGPIHGDTLKKALPILQPQGALPGVFKATRRWIRLGGIKQNSPFAQVE